MRDGDEDEDVNEPARDHLATCERFGEVIDGVRNWDAASPCADWDARDLLEHVIGFHDVLLLRPLSAKPERPRDDPSRRWSVTVDALRALFQRPQLFEHIVEVPALANNAPTKIDARTIVPMLTQDVLVHTWDMARTAGVDDHLDERLCAVFLERLPQDDSLQRSGMFGSAVAVSAGSSVQTKLLARLGRDPTWTHT